MRAEVTTKRLAVWAALGLALAARAASREGLAMAAPAADAPREIVVSGGVVHELPEELKAVLLASEALRLRWEDLTPLARNEWICWVTSAKKDETRQVRIRRLREELKEGKRRPCCWPGCSHREKTGR